MYIVYNKSYRNLNFLLLLFNYRFTNEKILYETINLNSIIIFFNLNYQIN